jgi:sugar-specific transcriptional regulator TrmB
MEAEKLTKLGLLGSEARVYLELLKLGQSSAGIIAKETRLNRGSVYKGINSLLKLGLISYVIRANRKEFKASNPKTINKLIEEKQKNLSDLQKEIPSLLHLHETTKKKVVTNIYEGIKGAKAIWEILLDECKAGDEWLILGAPKSAELLGGFFKDFNKRRAKKRVKLNIIYNKNAKKLIEVRKKQPLTTVRVMPPEAITPASIEVVNDNALLVIYEPELIVFHIKSKEVSDSFRNYFRLLWMVGN